MSQLNPVPESGPAVLAPRTEPQALPDFEGRSWPRFEAPPGTTCRVTTTTGRETVPAVVENVSCGGARFIVQMPLPRGTCVLLELHSRSGLFVRVLLAHVIYVAPAPDGRVVVGAEFLDPLGPEELRQFLA